MTANPYQVMIDRLDELVKSRFIEMFGDQNGICYPTCSIRDMLTGVYGGGTPSKAHPEYYGGNIPWVTSKDVKQFYTSDSEIHITEQGLDNSTAKIVPSDSIILVVRSGILKHTLPVSVTTRPVSINQDLKGLVVRTDTNPIYLAHVLRNQESRIIGSSRATTVDNIEIKKVLEIEVPNPPKIIQNQFADFVKQVDKSKTILRRMKEKYDFLVKSRFIEMFEGIHASEWPIRSLSESCVESDDIKCGPFGTQLSKNDYTSDGVAIWGIPEINSGLMKKPTQYISEEKARKLAAFEIRSGDIVMSRKGNVGQCSVFPNSYPTGILHSDAIRIRINPDLMNPTFLMFELHFSQYVRSQIMAVSLGAIMPGINVSKLKGMNVYVPPLSLQDEFVRFVQQVDKSRFIQQRDGIRGKQSKESIGGDGYDE